MGKQRVSKKEQKDRARSGERMVLRSEYYQELALEYAGGSFPIECYFCHETVLGFGHSLGGAAHHLDHDPTNHTKDNLAVVHSSCHQQYHGSQPRNYPHTLSMEHRLAIGAGVRGTVHTSESRANMAEAARRRYEDPEQREATGRKFRGKPKTKEHRQKLSEASSARFPCEFCGAMYTKTWLKRHRCPGGK